MLPQQNQGMAGSAPVSNAVAPRSYPILAPLPLLLTTLCILFLVPDAGHFLYDTNHGYQLALGITLAQGALPGLDTVTQYGPLVSVFSFVAWSLTGNIVAEVAICALGYAIAITLCHGFLRRHASPIIATLAAVALFLTMAPYYKWYYWLTPLIGLPLAEAYRHRILASRPVGVLLLGWGLFAGTAWLIRIDLWLEAAVFGLLMIGAVHLERWRLGQALIGTALAGTIISHAIRQFLPGLLVILGFIALVWFWGDAGRVADFLMSMQDGVADTVVAYRMAPFDFVRSPILHLQNILASLQVLIPPLYLAGVVLGLREIWQGQGQSGFPLLAVALTGLGILPQALHRADLDHLFEVIPPFILLCGLLLFRLDSSVWSMPARLLTGGMLGVVASFLLICGLLGHGDLVYAARNPLRVWQDIARLPESDPAPPRVALGVSAEVAAAMAASVADMARAIRRETPRNVRGYYLMAMTPSPLIFFAERRQAGLFPIHEPGMYASPYWLPRNRERLATEPPDFIVVSNNPDALPDGLPPELARQWRETFTRTAHRNAQYTLLLRP